MRSKETAALNLGGFSNIGDIMKLYQDNGYFNAAVLNQGYFFNVVIGGRGTGKTFNCLLDMVKSKTRFMLMRRTQAQLDLINKKQFSPLNPIAAHLGIEITTQLISKYNAAYCIDGEEIGYSCALSTVANMRGFDASSIDVLLYDEFIPEKHERPMKFEGQAFFNAYETINRNRELSGKPPLKVVLLSNSNDIYSPILAEAGLLGQVLKMGQTGREIYQNSKTGVAIYLLGASPVSAEKRETALYKLAGDSDFSRMALDNDFVGFDDACIQSRNLREYKPLVALGEVCIYEHKQTGEIYCSSHFSGTPPRYPANETGFSAVRKIYPWLVMAVKLNDIIFENITCRYLLTKYLN